VERQQAWEDMNRQAAAVMYSSMELTRRSIIKDSCSTGTQPQELRRFLPRWWPCLHLSLRPRPSMTLSAYTPISSSLLLNASLEEPNYGVSKEDTRDI
jgi:hypothetical protein